MNVEELPSSNWQWATVCLLESLAALRREIQAARFQLGGAPRFSQTDNATAATLRIPSGGRGENRFVRDVPHKADAGRGSRVRFAGDVQLTGERLRGDKPHRIDYGSLAKRTMARPMRLRRRTGSRS